MTKRKRSFGRIVILFSTLAIGAADLAGCGGTSDGEPVACETSESCAALGAGYTCEREVCVRAVAQPPDGVDRVPSRAALVFSVTPPVGGQCPASGMVYSLPTGPDALTAIENTGGENLQTGEVYRVIDGEPDTEVSCRVSQVGDTAFQFEGTISKSRSLTLIASGTIRTNGGTISVSEWDANSGFADTVSAQQCAVDLVGPPAKYIAPGAVWASFTCPEFGDGVIQCAAEGTFIFENCEQQ